MMQWRKHGVIFCPDGSQWWARSHAMIPTPILLNKETIRVFFSGCDTQGIGRPGYVDVSANDPSQVIKASTAPLFDIGRSGTFDDNGVVVTSVVQVSEQLWYLYYVGFELGSRIRYRLLTGLAVSEDGGHTWQRYRDTPILERSPQELCFRCGPHVIRYQDHFRMWYIAGSDWLDLNGKLVPIYVMKYLESSDGINWGGEGITCMEISDLDEHGFGRPWILINSNDSYELYYSIRRKSLEAYRLGYAISSNGLHWQRRDTLLNLDVSADGPDNQAIMYSAVIRTKGREWCFYNGNDFGRSGIMLAERMSP